MFSTAFLLGWMIAEPIPIPSDAAIKKEQEQCWVDLEQFEVSVVLRATLKLSVRPNESVHFLKTKVKPLKIEKDEVVRLLKNLDSNDDKVWKPASETLRYFDPRLVMNVRDAYETIPAGPNRMRILAILSDQTLESFEGKEFLLTRDDDKWADFKHGEHTWCIHQKVGELVKRKWQRLQHAIVLLEHIKTREATELLEILATGHRDAEPTKNAKDALKRLKAN